MKTADPELMRAINRFHVMDAIRSHGPIARVELADRLELSAATVSAITAALLEDGLIQAEPAGPGGEASRGRPRVRLALNPAAAFVVGIKMAPQRISIAVTDFTGATLGALDMPVRCERQPPAVITDLIEDGTRACVSEAGLSLPRIAGLGLGLPGVVDSERGLAIRGPIFGERAVPLAGALAERLGVPVRMASDADLMALAEHWFGLGRGLSHFVVVGAEHSVGLGMIVDNALYKGAGSLGADLGWFPTLRDGRLVPLERCVTHAALLARLAELAPGATAAAGIDLLLAEVGRGEPMAVRVFEEAATALGRALAAIASILVPPRLIVAGRDVQAGPIFLRPLAAAFEAALSPAVRDHVELVVHDLGDDRWARGAAALILRDLYGAPWSMTGPARRSEGERR